MKADSTHASAAAAAAAPALPDSFGVPAASLRTKAEAEVAYSSRSPGGSRRSAVERQRDSPYSRALPTRPVAQAAPQLVR